MGEAGTCTLEAVEVTVIAAKAVLLVGEECVLVVTPWWSCPSVVLVVTVAAVVDASGRGEGDLAALWEAREAPLLPLLLVVPS